MKSNRTFFQKNIIRTVQSVLSMVMIMLLPGCKADIPEDVLDQSAMADLLYDYHMAQRLGQNLEAEETTGVADADYNEAYYTRAVLKKHRLTEADFDRNLGWYTRNTEAFSEVYARLNERLAGETGGKGTASKLFANAQSADTANIWQGNDVCLLSSSGTNYMTFEQKADTMVHPEDRLMLHFRSVWMYREGNKTAIVQLALVYDNDSVAAVTTTIRRNGVQELTISTGKRPLKSIKGFIYQQAEWAAKPKLLALSDFALIRFRSKDDANKALVEDSPNARITRLPDSAAVRPARNGRMGLTPQQRLRDSLQADEARQKAQPHFK